MILTFDDVSYRFPGTSTPLLSHASFGLKEASVTALIGPNGIGKTTLLRLATGVLRPDSGTIRIAGQPLGSMSIKQAARTVAIVPQQLEIPFAYTVHQVVEQGRTPHIGFLASPKAQDREAIDRALELTSTQHLRHRIFNELSGGERQRVKIALGLAQQPALLLLDEPTQNLDIGRQVELLDLLHTLRHEGITVLASIHDLHLIEGNFSQVLLLSHGEELQAGAPADMLSAEILERAFDCPPSRHPMMRREYPMETAR